jgi:hypothetical protein
MSIDEILAQVPNLVDEIMRLRRTLRILYISQLEADGWGIRCVEDHNAIIREALGETEEMILQKQESDLEELGHEAKLNDLLENWIARYSGAKDYEPK